MSNAFFNVPIAKNEIVRDYAPGSTEREQIQRTLRSMKSNMHEIPSIIGGKEVYSGNTKEIVPPHELNHKLGVYHEGGKEQIHEAISAAHKAKKDWENTSWEDRAAIFLKAADLLSGPYRDLLNASTMLGQSKNIYQAEIDAACELCDFFRFNVQYMTELYAEQPISGNLQWNRMEYRPLEGFVLAITPFNFTSICANLPASAALMGNTTIWKPASTQIYSAYYTMKLFKEAGLPDGVINLILTDGPTTGDICFRHEDFSGIHFTGSTHTFQYMWKTIGEHIGSYKTYPRIVGETGGKDFVIAHPSADVNALATALSRGAFEYQGQKCSAASRAYIPKSIWEETKQYVLDDLSSMKMGTVEDFGNFINAVIDERSFDKITGYIDQAKKDGQTIIAGGTYSKEEGYFIEPTIIVADDPFYTTMREEIFGPVLTIYVYDDNTWSETLKLVDSTSGYALTGAVFSQDRYAIQEANVALRNAAGNFYINDKPTGAVVGQQPFGGSRASGTNDKAGSKYNLMRWVSMRTIKETLLPPKDYRYPFLG